MLRSMTVTNPNGESLKIELMNPEASGFLVVGIEGLDPPEADVFMTKVAAYDGSAYNSSSVESREIEISLVYYNNDIEAQRHKSYRYFPIKGQVSLLFENDSRRIRIDGYVKSNEIAIFTKMQGSKITVVCPDPWFVSGAGTEESTTLSNTVDLFEFQVEFTDELVEFSRFDNEGTSIIQYNGDVEVGVTFTLRVAATCGNVTIVNLDTNERLTILSNIVKRIANNTALTAGDVVTITTMQGQKSAKLRRGTNLINILAAVDKQSTWLKLRRGTNRLAITSASNNADVELTVTNRVLYEGI